MFSVILDASPRTKLPRVIGPMQTLTSFWAQIMINRGATFMVSPMEDGTTARVFVLLGLKSVLASIGLKQMKTSMMDIMMTTF